MNPIVRDNGYRSRKLWFAVAAVAVLFIAWMQTATHPTLIPTFDTFVGGLVAIVVALLTGSVATKWVGSKVPADPKVKKIEEDGEA
jgi:hypothetical protein